MFVMKKALFMIKKYLVHNDVLFTKKNAIVFAWNLI